MALAHVKSSSCTPSKVWVGLAHFGEGEPDKIVNGVGEIGYQLRELARAQVEDWVPTHYGLTAVASVAGIGTSYESPRL